MKERYPVHPYLFALFPVLVAFVHNYREIPASQVVLPLLVVLLLTFVLTSAAGLVVKARGARALLVSPVMLVLLSYGEFYDLLKLQIDRTPWRVQILIGAALLTALLYLVYCRAVVSRASRGARFPGLNAVLNGVSVVLVAFNLLQLGMGIAGSRREPASPAAHQQAEKRPDIYYIILDQYASLDEMKNAFRYDNEGFARALSAKGFVVCRNSTSPFSNTDLSITTSLNMAVPEGDAGWPADAPLDVSLASSVGMENPRASYTHRMIRDNAVLRELKSRGYRYIHFGSWWYDSSHNKRADVNFNCSGFRQKNEFGHLLVRSSILRLCLANKRTISSGILAEFDELARAPDLPGPKFVFAHVICPHSPYVFGRNGEYAAGRRAPEQERYLDQYIFVTSRVEQLVGDILARSKTPPVIIIQSDHGSKLFPDYSHRIFLALLLPGVPASQVPDALSTPDIFRVVFNAYFKV